MRLRTTITALALMFASTAQAATVSEVQSSLNLGSPVSVVDSLTSIRPRNSSDYTIPLTGLSNRFDTSLGTLNSVTLRFDGKFSTDTKLIGQRRTLAASTAEGEATHNVSVAIGNSPTNTATIGADNFSTTVTCFRNRGIHNLCTDVSERTRDLSFETTFNATDWMALESLTSVRFFLTQNIRADVIRGERMETLGAFDGGNITTSFNFTPPIAPVPLPASGMLLFAGLGGFALLRRRARG